ncbi:rhamnosyl/mannosyltransferase [Pseudomonas nitritireducens]|uniref:Rhamnosyl/mannosyltransferase n=1 Tax=Pseudomonas nitroreducens TaxID=46680 RepID=A0A7W7KIM0_PSENT|nr:glycosyltransferase [Pseudomonas nitritireducens]MBB4862993.1 rhamnosyl/mannosyltransferase [Pseudomonas nitritireducens]
MANKRVLLVNKYYAPSTGGIETAVKQYAHWYSESGHEVTVLCCANQRLMRSQNESIDGIRVLRAASLGNLLSVPLSFAFFWHFLLLARKADITHINLQFPSASLALWLGAWLINGKTVVSYHCDVYRQRYLKRLTYLFDRFAVRRADLVITGSPALRQHSEVLRDITREIAPLPYTVDLQHVERCLAGSARYVLPEHFEREGYCVFFGRLVSYKGTEALDAAFRQLMANGAQVNLLVFGVGPEEQRFWKLAEEFPERMHFINDFVSDVDKYHLIRNSRVFLFPSVYYSEAFGIAQLDAMACARPVINCWLETGVNWVAPNEEAAVTVEAGNPEKLAEAIMGLLNDPAHLASLGQGALQRCRTLFAEDRVRARFIELVRQL